MLPEVIKVHFLTMYIFICSSRWLLSSSPVILWVYGILQLCSLRAHSMCAGCSVVSANCSLLDHRFPELENRGLAVCNTENGQLAFFPLRSVYVLLTAHTRLRERPSNIKKSQIIKAITDIIDLYVCMHIDNACYIIIIIYIMT